jgi:hypothetical protein
MGLPTGLFVHGLLINGHLYGLIWFVQIVHYPLFLGGAIRSDLVEGPVALLIGRIEQVAARRAARARRGEGWRGGRGWHGVRAERRRERNRHRPRGSSPPSSGASEGRAARTRKASPPAETRATTRRPRPMSGTPPCRQGLPRSAQSSCSRRRGVHRASPTALWRGQTGDQPGVRATLRTAGTPSPMSAGGDQAGRGMAGGAGEHGAAATRLVPRRRARGATDPGGSATRPGRWRSSRRTRAAGRCATARRWAAAAGPCRAPVGWSPWR